MEQVWDVQGRKHFTFEGHETPVYSICPHHKENIQVWHSIIYHLLKETVKVDDIFPLEDPAY